jgi:hypothetical protein
LLAQGDDIAPTPGTKRGSRVEENIAADTIQLSPEQIDRLNKLPPAAGDHHNEQQMQMLDRSSAGTARPVSTPTTYLTPLTGRMATAAMMAQIPAAA